MAAGVAEAEEVPGAVVVEVTGTAVVVVEVPGVAQRSGAPPCRTSPSVPSGDTEDSALGPCSVSPNDHLRGSRSSARGGLDESLESGGRWAT